MSRVQQDCLKELLIVAALSLGLYQAPRFS